MKMAREEERNEKTKNTVDARNDSVREEGGGEEERMKEMQLTKNV